MSSSTEPDDRPHEEAAWRFLSNHSQVLLCIDRDPNVRLRDVAATVGITERAVQRIVGDLVESGYVNVERVGRRNHYTVNRGVAMRHPAQTNTEIGELLDLLVDDAGPSPAGP
ncbi:MAG TPA: winged helix-turn-helix transcriptional regulator [Gaiellaceae bacterium]|nr:winged helix-turn-helix transcriptional regulator [Gaiellaceae bacterium]